MDIGKVLLRLNRREDAIKFLEKAYEIYAATRHNEDLDKAEMANQIATLLNDFGSYKDAIDFAIRSNTVYDSKKSLVFVPKIMQNNRIIAEAKNRLGEYEEAMKRADDLYNNVTNDNIWDEGLGEIIVESTKITFEALLRSEYKDIQSRVYYVLDMIDESERNKTVNRQAAIRQLKNICEANKSPSFLLKKIFADIRIRPTVYSVDNLVNVTIEEFLSKLPPHQQVLRSVLKDVLQSMLVIYHCLGPKFLLPLVNPHK